MAQPVIEVGGTHVTAALVDAGAGRLRGPAVREPLPARGPAGEVLDRIAAAASRLGAPAGARWGVAVPGPFDYAAGVARYEGVGKFDALHGVDVRAALRARIRPAPAALHFLNDADAFGLGEHAAGAAAGHARAVCVTLGTGVGSVFLADGVPVHDGPLVPPGGYAYLLRCDGRPLEDTVSRRGIRAAYARAAAGGPGAVPDVRDIADRARAGDAAARAVLRHAFEALGRTLAPWLARFEATVLVVGGSVAASWDLLEAPLRSGLGEGAPPPRAAELPHEAPLLGAARWALRADPASADPERAGARP